MGGKLTPNIFAFCFLEYLPHLCYRLNSQLALAEDGDWGTYRKFFHDETFIATFSDYVGKVLSSASGCACKFIGQMFFATGLRPARWCAASMINDLEKAGWRGFLQRNDPGRFFV